MKIGIIGGTGPQGQGIALRWSKAGRKIIIGSRLAERAENIARDLNSLVGNQNITGLANDDMIKQSEIILLTVPFEHAESTLKGLIYLLKLHCKIFVDVTVPMTYKKGKGMVIIPIPEGSSAQLMTKLLVPIPVVAAFKTIGSHMLNKITEPLGVDTFVLGPQEERMKIINIITEIEGLRPLNAGPIREAQAMERLVPFLINLNRRYKVKDAGVKIIF